jgi:hypothetical protein
MKNKFILIVLITTLSAISIQTTMSKAEFTPLEQLEYKNGSVVLPVIENYQGDKIYKNIVYTGDPCVDKSDTNIDQFLYDYSKNGAPSPKFDIEPMPSLAFDKMPKGETELMDSFQKNYLRLYIPNKNFIEEKRTLAQNIDDLALSDSMLKTFRANSNTTTTTVSTTTTGNTGEAFNVQQFSTYTYYNDIKESKSLQEARKVLSDKKEVRIKELQNIADDLKAKRQEEIDKKGEIEAALEKIRLIHELNKKAESFTSALGFNFKVDLFNATTEYNKLSGELDTKIIQIADLLNKEDEAKKNVVDAGINILSFDGLSKKATGEMITNAILSGVYLGIDKKAIPELKGLPNTSFYLNSLNGDVRNQELFEGAIRSDRRVLISKVARGDIKGKEYREQISTALNNECLIRKRGEDMNKLIPFVSNAAYIILITVILFSFFRLALAFGTGENEKVPKLLRGIIVQVILLGICTALFAPVKIQKSPDRCEFYNGYRINEIWSSKMYTEQIGRDKRKVIDCK